MTTPRAPQQTFFHKANGVLAIREEDGRVRPATAAESAEYSARRPRRWWTRFGRRHKGPES
jgi:hypothetical protein